MGGQLDSSMKLAVSSESTPAEISTGRLSVGEKIGYGLGDFASNLYWKTWEFFLIYFYTDVFGLTARSAGQLMLVTRVFDAVSDPLVGYMADRTRSSWGRFRPYLLWMSLPLAITAVLTFTTPDLPPTAKLVYAYVTYTAVMFAYTAINIPYGAMLGVISADSAERTSVSTYRFVSAFCGGLIVQWFTLDLVRWFGGTRAVVINGAVKEVVENESRGFTITMAIFATIAVVMFVITFLSTRERVEPESNIATTYRADVRFVLTSIRLHQTVLILVGLMLGFASMLSWSMLGLVLAGYVVGSVLSLALVAWASGALDPSDQPSSLEADFHDLCRNGPWVALFLFGLLQLTGLFVRGGAILYYFKYYCNDASLASTFWVVGGFSAIAGMLLTKPLVARFSKRSLLFVLNIGVAESMLVFYFLRPDQTGWMFAAQALAGFIGGPIPVLLWAMYADVVDYSEWKTHRRATGLIFAAATFSQKLGCAVGAAMTGFTLDFFLYAPPIGGIEQTQSDFTIDGIRWMVSVIPAALLVAASATLWLYCIDRKTEQSVQTELATRKQMSAGRRKPSAHP